MKAEAHRKADSVVACAVPDTSSGFQFLAAAEKRTGRLLDHATGTAWWRLASECRRHEPASV